MAQYLYDTGEKVGGYPFVDFFMTLKIASLKLFFKTEHLNSGLLGNTYFQTINYPQPDRAFKLGIIWVFHY